MKKPVIIALCLSVFLFLNFFGKAFLRRRNAMKVVQAVLTCWEENDIPQSYRYWEEEHKAAPVYDLLSHELGRATFGKEDGVYTAVVPVTLYFPDSHTWPSEKVWIFRLEKTPYGWKITDFRRASP